MPDLLGLRVVVLDTGHLAQLGEGVLLHHGVKALRARVGTLLVRVRNLGELRLGLVSTADHAAVHEGHKALVTRNNSQQRSRNSRGSQEGQKGELGTQQHGEGWGDR